MRFNPTRVPWLVVCGLIGAAIGYLGFQRGEGGDNTLPGMYGLLVGTVVGMIAWGISLFLANRAAQASRETQDSSGDEPPSAPPQVPPA